MKKINSNYFDYPILFVILLFCLFSISYGQTIQVQGKIMTDNQQVKYCKISFIYEDDTTRHFSTISDRNGYYKIGIITGVPSQINEKQNVHNLMQNYPNPFIENTVITYKLLLSDEVSIRIYNILGQIVKNIERSNEPPGFHQINWDGKDNNGNKVSYGVYFYRIETRGWTDTKKMLYLFSGRNSLSFSSLKGSFIGEERILKQDQCFEKGYYKILFTNTEKTQPEIKEKEIKHLLIEKDSTLDFTVDPQFNYCLFVEVLRMTYGKFVGGGSHGSFDIDFKGYLFNEDKGELIIGRNLGSPYNIDSVKLICGFDRSLSGNLGGGHSGGIIAYSDFPKINQIMSFPLPSNDSIEIINMNKSGEFYFQYKSYEICLDTGKVWSFIEQKETNTILGGGNFLVNDTISILNHGFLEKRKIR